jgi:hypothetical protein
MIFLKHLEMKKKLKYIVVYLGEKTKQKEKEWEISVMHKFY